MGEPFNRRTLLVGAAATAAGLAGASALGLGVAGATTNGPGRNGISKAKPKKGGSLVFGVDAEESGFNPTTARFDEVGVMYARTVFDPLTIINAAGTWEPYLAESVTPNADHTAWTITVRPNVVFHDGTPCNGAALLTNFEAQKASLLLGTLILVPILDTLTQSGPNAVTLTFKSPWVSFPLYLAGGIGGQSAYMCAPSMLSAPNGGTSQPVGTGPFVFKEWVPNSHFTATANPHYWRPGLPYLDEITFKPIIDENARAEALKSGTIDIMVTDTPQIITQFRGNKQYAYIDDSTHLVGEPDMNCILLNLAAEPFNNPSVRRAAAMAINRAQYAKEIDDNVLPVSDGAVHAGLPLLLHHGLSLLQPDRGQETGQAGGEVDREAGDLHLRLDQRTGGRAGTGVPPAGLAGCRIRGQEHDRRAERPHQRRAGRDLRGPRVAAVRRCRPRPQLHLLEHHHHPLEQPFHQYGPQHDPQLQAALELGRQSSDPAVRAKAYQTVNKRLAIDLPYLWTDRAVWSVESTLKVQNWNNPTTPSGAPAYGMIGGSIWPTQIWLS